MLAGQVLVIVDLMVVLKDNPDFTQNYVELGFFLILLQHSMSRITRMVLMLLLLNVCRAKKEEKRL